MTRTKAIAAIIAAAALAALAVFLDRQSAIDTLAARNQSLRQQLQQAQAGRQAALAKVAAREAELQTVRRDSAVLARLREQLKTNPPPSAPPPGFYIGKDPPVYVSYGTPDPLLQAFIQSVMTSGNDPTAKARAIYGKICAACHQPGGGGKDGVAPPLAGSEWVLAPGGARLVRIVLNGLTGPIRVQGRDWNLPMPPWRENLKDDEIAVVLTYIRSNLGGNNAGSIKPSLVAAAREEPHPGPETSEELLRVSDQ
ncbi:MAG: cytochrome c [Verrucomicrobiota bacterium]|jgi:mono/diheme cytochrome c family protein